MTAIIAISAGLGDPSTTRMLAEKITESVRAQFGDAHVELVDLREFAHEITDAALNGFAAPRLQHIYDQILAAEALIAVTPIFKASYPGLFKSFFDAMESDALVGKPVLVAATGGTARHSLAIDFALRPLFAYLQTLTVPTGVFASPADWGTEGTSALSTRIERAAGELVSLLKGSGTGRTRDEDFDLFSDTMRSISGIE